MLRFHDLQLFPVIFTLKMKITGVYVFHGVYAAGVGRNTKYKTVILFLYFVTSRLLWYDEIQNFFTVLYFVSCVVCCGTTSSWQQFFSNTNLKLQTSWKSGSFWKPCKHWCDVDVCMRDFVIFSCSDKYKAQPNSGKNNHMKKKPFQNESYTSSVMYLT